MTRSARILGVRSAVRLYSSSDQIDAPKSSISSSCFLWSSDPIRHRVSFDFISNHPLDSTMVSQSASAHSANSPLFGIVGNENTSAQTASVRISVQIDFVF